MSISLEQYVWPTTFATTLITDKLILPNHYTMTIAIEPVAPPEIALGFRRLRSFVDNFLHNSIFISSENPLMQSLADVETNRVIFPTDPYDYFVGCVLYRKFQMITHNYFEIGMITIDSALGDHIQYCIRDPEETGLELTGNHWWNIDSLDTGPGTHITWEDLDLSDSPKFEPRIIKGGRSENR
jgi:hypothetical protein